LSYGRIRDARFRSRRSKAKGKGQTSKVRLWRDVPTSPSTFAL